MDSKDYSEAANAGAMEEFRVAIRQATEANVGRKLLAQDARWLNLVPELRVTIPGIVGLRVTWDPWRSERTYLAQRSRFI